jgi:hypothetical protein
MLLLLECFCCFRAVFQAMQSGISEFGSTGQCRGRPGTVPCAAWPSCACSTRHLALARCLRSPPRLTLAERKKASVFSSLSHSLPLPSARPHRALSLLELSTATATSPCSGLLAVPPSRRCGLAARCSHLLVGPASPRRCAWPRGLGLSRAGLWPPGAWSAAAPPWQPRSALSPWSTVANLAGTGLPRAVLLHLCRGRRRRRVESQIETFFRVHFA